MIKCPYCGKSARLTTGREIYPHREDLYSKNFYICSPCKAYVGCHPTNKRPLGRLANAELRALRIEAHSYFDPIWKDGKMTRTEAYNWLANKLGIRLDMCHIGMFEIARCRKVIEACAHA